jgi:hypothetical protein
LFEPLRRETDRAGLEIRKSFQVKGLRMSSAESIVTKRVALAELKFQARKEPPYWLTQNAVSPSLRRFAFIPSLFKGLCRFGSGGSDSLSEPVALRVREQTSWFGTHPESNPPKLSQSLFNKRCYLTTRLLSHPEIELRKSDRRVNPWAEQQWRFQCGDRGRIIPSSRYAKS